MAMPRGKLPAPAARRRVELQRTQRAGAASDLGVGEQTNDELRESEERLRHLLESTDIIPWEADAETWRFTYVGPQAVRILGYPIDRWFEEGFWDAHIHPDDREWAIEFCLRSSRRFERYDFEYRMVSVDGAVVWLHDLVQVVSESGRPKLLRGFMVDITERKRAHQALRDLSGRLIRAQEDERRRIARELHDEFNQRLALLAIDLETLGRDLPAPSAEVAEQVRALSAQVRQLSSDVHRLSHELHPSKLDQLGLVTSLGSLCRELADKHGLRIDFSHRSVPRSIPGDVALCLYRVAQEGLQNVVKHSAATQTRVRLDGRAEAIRLRISDTGVGFNVESPKQDQGLGLVSMRERVRLVNGEFAIESAPARGTRIDVRVPLGPTGS